MSSAEREPVAITDLDHAATTRLRPEARAAMEPFLGDRYGNPSGAHALARDAVRAVDEARERVAGLLGRAPGEVVFTSGGTEADVHAVTGGLPARSGTPVCSAVEHPAVLEPVHALGGRVVAVDALGRVDLDALDHLLAELGPATSVVSVMAANNEVGTINDLDAVAAVVRRHTDAPIHTDAVQAAAWLDLGDVAAPADLVSVSAHKFGGPKGVGVLVVRAGTALSPLLRGGGQERGRRSGTTNVAGVVGLAAALDATARDRARTNERVGALRDRLADGLAAAVGDLRMTVAPERDRSHLLPGTCHLTIEGADSEELLLLLDRAGVAASAASSCASGAQHASHVLAALVAAGNPAAASGGASLRLSLGWDSTEADVDRVLTVLPEAVGRIRAHRGRVLDAGRP
ncbi:MAG: cysteine desulfurase family protein [Microthrixaceae bacterium]